MSDSKLRTETMNGLTHWDLFNVLRVTMVDISSLLLSEVEYLDTPILLARVLRASCHGRVFPSAQRQ